MPTELKMPALSPTMEEGTLAKWLVKEGDEVKSGVILAEIDTDKATMEFEAVDEGVIADIAVAEGTEGVKVGTVIATLAEDGEDPAAAKSAKARASPASQAVRAVAGASGLPPSRNSAPPPITRPQITSSTKARRASGSASCWKATSRSFAARASPTRSRTTSPSGYRDWMRPLASWKVSG